MPINFNNPLNDSLDNLFGGKAPEAPVEHRPRPELTTEWTGGEKTFREACTKCGGSGQTRWGTCFRCKGKGGKTFKTSPESRAQGRAQAAAHRETKRIEKLDERRAWAEEHKAEVTWLLRTAGEQETKMGTGRNFWAFPIQLAESLAKWGSLTDGQLAAVRKCMARDVERAAERKQAQANATEIDVSKIEAAFAKARGDAADDGEGVKWLRLRLDTFTFSDAPARGQWPAAIFVKEGETKLGRIVAGKFIRSRECSEDQATRIVTAASDPAAAAKAYGMRTGSCSCCGRELTNRESIDLGIGPICAGKYGFI